MNKALKPQTTCRKRNYPAKIGSLRAISMPGSINHENPQLRDSDVHRGGQDDTSYQPAFINEPMRPHKRHRNRNGLISNDGGSIPTDGSIHAEKMITTRLRVTSTNQFLGIYNTTSAKLPLQSRNGPVTN
jgi:hypothetical protein